MTQKFSHIDKINGEISFPGDKSISHRALIFSALAKGNSEITNLSDAEDVKSTLNCLEKLGVEIKKENNSVIIGGVGRNGFKTPESNLDCGNSGTTARLLSGVLAAQNFPSVIVGDDSLSQRPMGRIIDPLKKMGCEIESNQGKFPLRIYPTEKLEEIEYHLPMPSAQVKGAILLAGLHCDETTTIIENNLLARDHTERMLNLPVEIIGDTKIISVSCEYYPEPADYFIPGDISTAAFFIVLTLLSSDSQLVLQDVSLNKTRSIFLDLLIKMGAEINVEIKDDSMSEPYGNIFVKSSDLKNIEIEPEIIPGIIDEIPVLTIAGALADGEFLIRGAKELRLKESDRIKSICANLKLTGMNVDEFDDGFSISGKMEQKNNLFESYRDHRIAMAFSVLSCLLKSGGEVNGIECVNISNQKFLKQIESITVQ